MRTDFLVPILVLFCVPQSTIAKVASDFDYAEELKQVRYPPKPNFVQKLLFKQAQAAGREFIKDEIDEYRPAKVAIDAIPDLIDELPVDEMIPFAGWEE